ncbi:hypothetical protein [Hydrogenophaga intermedia]|jgi:hypothetical protein|uniref:hypothetical protein n=1 Tax=Hydrogenophaga intermedia TaxID=65786 RepID=UPI0020437081|nr:hypothetical protein [Hydrogenophaga intermedia]MCM3563385.1 hypothetical protein [Hydrogenophaga intermedia]
MDHSTEDQTHPTTPVHFVGQVPVEVNLPVGSEIECVGGHLWFTVRPPDSNFYVDDKFLVTGEKFLATQNLRIWVSSVRGEPAGYRVRPGVHLR